MIAVYSQEALISLTTHPAALPCLQGDLGSSGHQRSEFIPNDNLEPTHIRPTTQSAVVISRRPKGKYFSKVSLIPPASIVHTYINQRKLRLQTRCSGQSRTNLSLRPQNSHTYSTRLCLASLSLSLSLNSSVNTRACTHVTNILQPYLQVRIKALICALLAHTAISRSRINQC